MKKKRKPIEGSKRTTDPAAIAWRNLSPEDKQKTYGRAMFLELYNAGLLDQHARPTRRRVSPE